ncbi:MAG: rhodanese-like domain-containing protein [Bacteroidetes bacterium]|nr:rhodanese-like domain-containing protein [Bacteroidota bacterium]
MKHLIPEDAYRLISAGKAMLVDLREEEEYVDGVAGQVPVAFFPLSEQSSWPFSPEEGLHVLMCAHGIRSVRICALLNQIGVHNVVSLDGGFEQWKLSRMPVQYR